MVIPEAAVEAALNAFSAEIAKVGALHKDALRAALEAAAPHMPRTITAAEELDALPIGSVVLDGDVCVRRNDGYWKVSDLAGVYASKELTLPATVLYTPKES